MRIDLWKSGQTRIEAKEYLSRKDIEELILPESVTEIGNWAFAHMKNLKKIFVPKREIRAGREVFKGCDSLEQIALLPPGAETAVLQLREDARTGAMGPVWPAELSDKAFHDAGYLLAAAVVRLDGQALFRLEQAGSHEWMQEFDRLLLHFICEGDENGFNPMWFGGEEDYDDNDTNVELYRKKRQQEKLDAVLLRLLHDSFLTTAAREELYSFLREALVSRGGAFPAELWKHVAEKYGQDSRMAKVLTEASCVTSDNRKEALCAFGEICPEGKALLLGWCSGHMGKTDFFDGMELL